MKEVESLILRENKRQCRHHWPVAVSHCQQHFWSKFPTQDLPQTVLCALLHFSLVGSPTTPGCPHAWDLHDQQGREWSAWCPGTLKLVGRGRRNWFGLSNWSTGLSGPENEGKGNKYTTCSAIENGFLPYKMASVMLTTVPRLGAEDTGHKCLCCQFLQHEVSQGGIFCNSQTFPMIKFYIPYIICALEWHYQWAWY